MLPVPPANTAVRAVDCPGTMVAGFAWKLLIMAELPGRTPPLAPPEQARQRPKEHGKDAARINAKTRNRDSRMKRLAGRSLVVAVKPAFDALHPGPHLRT